MGGERPLSPPPDFLCQKDLQNLQPPPQPPRPNKDKLCLEMGYTLPLLYGTDYGLLDPLTVPLRGEGRVSSRRWGYSIFF